MPAINHPSYAEEMEHCQYTLGCVEKSLETSVARKERVDTYQCPDGAIKGEIKLKRQFSIDKGELREIFDIDITTNDEFLQTYLGANADNRLKLQKDAIVNQLHDDSDKAVALYKSTLPEGGERQSRITHAIDERSFKIEKIESISKKAVNDYISRTKLSPYEYYKEFMSDRVLFGRITGGRLEGDMKEFIVGYTSGILSSGHIEIEDIAAFHILSGRAFTTSGWNLTPYKTI